MYVFFKLWRALRKVPSIAEYDQRRWNQSFFGKKILLFFSRERCERICRILVDSRGVPKPLVDWQGMRVFPRWWSIYSKKARYWPQRGSCVVRTARFMGGRVSAATVHVHVTCAHVVHLSTHAWRQIFARRSRPTCVSPPCGVIGQIVHATYSTILLAEASPYYFFVVNCFFIRN